MERFFSVTEWLKDATTEDPNILKKIEWWMDTLYYPRAAFANPIVITHGLRAGDGTSQHYFKGMGATDCRPSLESDHYEKDFIHLGGLLVVTEPIRRICYYPPGKLFPNGGYHLDCKTQQRELFVSMSDKVNWLPVTETEFFDAIDAIQATNDNFNETGESFGI